MKPEETNTPRTDAEFGHFPLAGRIRIYRRIESARDFARTLERELAAAKAECERLRKCVKEEWDGIAADEILANIEAARFENTAIKASHASLCAALEDIGTLAHCISKAGPLTTPTLEDAWSKFDKISIKATAALTAANRIAALKVRESGAVGALEFALPWLQEGKEVCIEAQHFEEAVRVKEKQKAGERGLAALLAIITEGTP